MLVGRVGEAGWRERGRQLLRLAFTRHLGMTLLLLAGVVLRVAVMVGYQPAFWFHGDSGVYIRHSWRLLPPIDAYRPVGYWFLLKVLGPTHTLVSVVALQHLMGLAVAVAVYLFLLRRGLPRWLACLAAMPLLLDSLQVTIEHFILVETMFTTLLVASFLVLLWPRASAPKPTVLVCLVGGGLFFAAWLTKPLALPVFPIVVGYLLVRRVGVRAVAAFAAAFLLPYLLVQAVVIVSGRPSVYGSNSSALYGRAASIADCSRVPALTEQERLLCPRPGQEGMRPDWYIWADDAPGRPYRSKGWAYPMMRGFALAVLAAQPGDYLRQVGKEVAAHFVPGVDLGWSYGCLRERSSMPATARDTLPIGLQCHPQLASAGFRDQAHPYTDNPPATPLTTSLHGYSTVVRLAPVTLSVAVVLTLAAFLPLLLRRRRRGSPWLARDAGMLTLASLTFIVLPVVIGMYEARYGLPALPLLCIAGALSAHQLRSGSPRRPVARAEDSPQYSVPATVLSGPANRVVRPG